MVLVVQSRLDAVFVKSNFLFIFRTNFAYLIFACLIHLNGNNAPYKKNALFSLNFLHSSLFAAQSIATHRCSVLMVPHIDRLKYYMTSFIVECERL